MSGDIITADLAHEEHMARGSDWLLRSMQRARGEGRTYPRQMLASYGQGELIWSRSYYLPPRDKGPSDAVLAIHARDATADARRVKRDPCGFCGVRADIGCGHSRRVACL